MNEILEGVLPLFSQIRWQDLLDLGLLWIVFYKILNLAKRTGAVQVLAGLGVLALLYLSSIWLELIAFNYLLEVFFSNLFLILVILFQGEIRRALAQIGSNSFFSEASDKEGTHVVEELAKGAFSLAAKKHGALIVIEREIALEYFIEEGVPIDADVSSELLSTIFQIKSPLHDGAVIVRRGRVHSAGCFLPLSRNPVLDKNLGTRHRAALGLAEETDALVIVVSEEKGQVGLAKGGALLPDVEHASLRKVLYEELRLKFKTSSISGPASVGGGPS